jgi:hypothetical protein
MKKQRKQYTPEEKVAIPLPDHIFLARAKTGLHQILRKLRARVPTTRIVRQSL